MKIENLTKGEIGMYDLEQECYHKENYWKEKEKGEK